jgi:hypothetical protein
MSPTCRQVRRKRWTWRLVYSIPWAPRLGQAGHLSLKFSTTYLERTTFNIFIVNTEKDPINFFPSGTFILCTMKKNSLKKWFPNYVFFFFLNWKDIIFVRNLLKLFFISIIKVFLAGHWRLMSVILATQEAEIRMIMI